MDAVICIKHDDLPRVGWMSAAWAAAVNDLYAAGILIVAASGDSFYFEVMDIATRYTVYPSAFNRVVTALGATYDKKPYIAHDIGQMQGCWGPDAVMEKAIAGFTPNVPWMKFDTTNGFEMDGGGTSASTPQIAAACALWQQLYGQHLPVGWQCIEACRLALWSSAAANKSNPSELGWGLLNVPKMLDKNLATKAIEEVLSKGDNAKSAEDSVSVSILRLLFGWAPPGSEQEHMYETEVAQLIANTRNPDLAKAARNAATLGQADRPRVRDMLADEGASNALKQKLSQS